jgi:hypothetical protein
MKSKSVLFIALVVLISAVLITVQSCKNDAVVETPPPENQNPEVPALTEPTNQATIGILTPTLNWENFSGASSYRIQVSLDANFAGIVIMDSSGITASQINIRPGLFVTNSYYYWRVRAVTGSGATPWSSVWRFNVILSPPGAPNLVAPPNGAMNQQFTPTLDWSNVPVAQFYRVQISLNPVFNYTVFDSNMVPLSQITVPQFTLSVNSQYYWRVNAANSGGVSTGPWSAVWNFTTMDGPEPNTIKGTITFVDTNFLPLPSYYRVGAFNSWPPDAPVMYDSLIIVQSGGHYTAHYRIDRLDDGSYNIAVFPVLATSVNLHVLGIYGCDTVHVEYSNCPYDPTTVNIINGWGSENINFLSWADTTKTIL